MRSRLVVIYLSVKINSNIALVLFHTFWHGIYSWGVMGIHHKISNIIISIESVKVVYIVLYEIKRSPICTARIWKCARDRLRCSWFSKQRFIISEKKYRRRVIFTLLETEPQPLFMATRDQKKKIVAACCSLIVSNCCRWAVSILLPPF